MKIMRLLARLVFVVCLPIAIFTASIGLAFNSLSLYEYGFKKYNIDTVTGIDPTELRKAARDLISYWNSGEDWIDTRVIREGQPFALFNSREVVHLKDVKALVRLDYMALAVSGLCCLAYVAIMLGSKTQERRREAALAGVGGGALTLIIMAFMGVAAATNFSSFWWQFHLLSFANDFWLLDPRTDYLVMMFPECFWFDSVLIIAGLSVSLAVLATGLSWAVLRRNSSGK